MVSPNRGLLRDFEPSCRPSFEALLTRDMTWSSAWQFVWTNADTGEHLHLCDLRSQTNRNVNTHFIHRPRYLHNSETWRSWDIWNSNMGVMVLSRLNGRVSAPLCHSIGGHLLSLVSTWLEHRVEGPEPVQWFKCTSVIDVIFST